MSDLSSVDVDLDQARLAFDSSIDGVLAAVQSALDSTQAQIERLEGIREELEAKRVAVEAEIDGLTERAAQLEALALPVPVSTGTADVADEVNEVIEVIEYVDEDGYPVDEHGNPLEYIDVIEYEDEVVYVDELLLDEAPWSDLALPRTDRLVALVAFHVKITTAEAVEALAEVGDEVSMSTVTASLGNLARQGRITKLDAGLFGPA
jgi:hypothetical protein